MTGLRVRAGQQPLVRSNPTVDGSSASNPADASPARPLCRCRGALGPQFQFRIRDREAVTASIPSIVLPPPRRTAISKNYPTSWETFILAHRGGRMAVNNLAVFLAMRSIGPPHLRPRRHLAGGAGAASAQSGRRGTSSAGLSTKARIVAWATSGGPVASSLLGKNFAVPAPWYPVQPEKAPHTPPHSREVAASSRPPRRCWLRLTAGVPRRIFSHCPNAPPGVAMGGPAAGSQLPPEDVMP